MYRATSILVALAVLAAPAAASEFCGCNGVMTLSFTTAPEITRTTTVAPEDGITTVEVHAILDDVAPMEGPGGVVLAIGGFECELRIRGAEPLAVEKKILVPHRDFGQRPTRVWAGVDLAGERVDEGPLALVRWTVRFQGEPADVRFDLDPAGLLSCDAYPSCVESEVLAMYTGAMDVGQENYLFGAGCAPAVLNPVGAPDLAVVGCTLPVDEVGVFELR